MAHASVRARIAQDVALWQADGLISADTAAGLRRRYEQRTFGLGQVLRYLGTIGLVFVVVGVMGFIAAVGESEIVVGVLLILMGGAAVAGGVWLARDDLGRYPWSSKVVMTAGALIAAGGLAVLLMPMESSGRAIAVWGIVAVPALTLLAYTYRVPFLLTLAVLAFFHWIGSWEQMWGRSTYSLEIQDPHVMAVAALAVFGVGLWHEHALRDETGRFYRVYQAISLTYFNLSLLILTLTDSRRWIAVLSVATIAEVIAGARLRNRLLVSFGVTFLFINGFTRFYEHFWDSTSKGAFFLLSGAVTFAAAMIVEMSVQHARSKP